MSGSATTDEDAAPAPVPPVRRQPTRRRGSGAETRSKLLQSTRTLASTRTVPDFTVDDITAGAEVSRAAFYMYFENKLAICEEIAATTQVLFIDAVTTFDRGDDIRSRILSGVRAYIEGFNADLAGIRLMYELAFTGPTNRALVYDARTRVYALWEREFAWAVETGQCPPFDIPVLTRLLVGMLETYCTRTTRTEEYTGTSALTGDPVQTIGELWCRALQVAAR